MSGTDQTKDPRTLLFLGNRWVRTIYKGYGIFKQRILLEILQQAQPYIKEVMRGKNVQHFKWWKGSEDILVPVDMAKIAHYNNYWHVRNAISEMSRDEISIYMDPSYKQNIYREAPLLNGFETSDNKRIVQVRIKRVIMELLLHVDRKSNTAYQYTKFDKETIRYSSCRYMMPLYTMICSYAEKGGYTVSVEDLRRHLQVQQKYAGFDNMNKFILKHLQKEMQISGQYTFNYSLVKEGRTVKNVVFKIFKNKAKFDYNHVWLKIQRALTQELPYFVRFTPEQQEQFNYLLNGSYDLDQVYTKLKYIHNTLVKKKAQGERIHSHFTYTLTALHRDFEPPDI